MIPLLTAVSEIIGSSAEFLRTHIPRKGSGSTTATRSSACLKICIRPEKVQTRYTLRINYYATWNRVKLLVPKMVF